MSIPPGDLTGEVVLNDTGDWFLTALTVLGRLCLQSAEQEFGADAAAPSSHGRLRFCHVLDSSRLVPRAFWNWGVVRPPKWPPHSSLFAREAPSDIEGQLTLHPGSELVLESGATLQIAGGIHGPKGPHSAGQGAAWEHHPIPWPQRHGRSICQLKRILPRCGSVTLCPSTWPLAAPPLPGSRSIWTHFAVSALHCMPHASVSLHALEDETHWGIQAGAVVEIEGLGSWHQDRSGLRLLGGAFWKSSLSEVVRFDDTRWTGSEGDSVHVSGPLWLQDHQGSSVHLKHGQGECRMEHSSFIGGSTQLAHDKVRWRFCAFLDHPVVHAALGDEPAHLIENSRFEGAHAGLTARGPGRLRLEACSFNGHAMGLVAHSARLELACNAFASNDIGMVANKALIVMRPEGGGGWNLFEDNDVHLKFLQAPFPELAGGANHFGQPYSGWATGSINTPCNGGGLDWVINGQSWDWPSGLAADSKWALGLESRRRAELPHRGHRHEPGLGLGMRRGPQAH